MSNVFFKVVICVFCFVVCSCEIKFPNSSDDEFNFDGNCNSDKADKPSTNQINTDLIGSQVNGWRFYKLEEFLNVEELNSEIKKNDINSCFDDELVIRLKGYFKDFNDNLEYTGEYEVTYTFKNELSWEFKDVTGNIGKVIKSSDDFSIEYDLDIQEIQKECEYCGENTTDLEFLFPEMDFSIYDDPSKMSSMWESHKKEVIDEIDPNRLTYSFFGSFVVCPSGNGSHDFYKKNVFVNTKTKIFQD